MWKAVAMRKLYYYPLCAFSRTALLSLSEKKLDFSVDITKFWDPKGPLLELNAFGRLPVLEDLNGSLVAGVYAVVEYLEEAYADVPLLSADLAERAEARRIFQWMHEDFAAEVTTVLAFEKDIKRYLVARGSESAPSSAVMKRTKDAASAYFRQLEVFIDQRKWLAGDTFSIADIAAAAHISVVDYLGSVLWSHYPVLKGWYMRVKSRPSFKKILMDRVPGLLPAAHYTNLDF